MSGPVRLNENTKHVEFMGPNAERLEWLRSTSFPFGPTVSSISETRAFCIYLAEGANELQRIQRSLNGRPRATLGYMTPLEKFTEFVASTG
jgi:hypothetical protein